MLKKFWETTISEFKIKKKKKTQDIIKIKNEWVEQT